MPSRTDLGAHWIHMLTGHRRWCRANGVQFPLEFEVLLSSLSDSRGQQGPNLALSLAATEDSPVALNYPQAAARLGLSVRTIKRMTADGRLPVVRVGSRALVPVAGIDEYLESQRDHQGVAN